MTGAGRRALAGYSVLAKRSPALAYRSLDGLARASAPIRDRHLPPQRFTALFPHLSPSQAEAAARRSWSTRLRYSTLKATRRRYGLQSLRGVVLESPEIRALRAPAVLVGFHVGPLSALGAVLGQLPGPAAALAGRVLSDPDPNVTLLMSGRTQQDSGRAFLRAHRFLEQGGFVFVPVDGPLGTRVEVPFLGARIALARGAFALARRSEVPIVPVVARWAGTRIATVVGDTVPPGAGDEELAASVARWLEQYLRRHPGELSTHLLQQMRGEPR